MVRGPGTFRKRGTFVHKEQEKKTKISREDMISLIETEELFDLEEHRVEMMNIMITFIKDTRRKKLMEVLENKIFLDAAAFDEALTILTEFVRVKSNNNE